jgi:beta-glucosidase
VKLASSADIVLLTLATTSSEGSDRPSLSLGEEQDALVEQISSVNKNLVVNVNTPGAVLLPWSEKVKGLLISWMPGQEAGNALADVLFGKINPSGRLSVTMPNIENEVGFTPEEFPGTGDPKHAKYNEQLLIGYRWYLANNVQPKYPFGFGLSYTSFTYSDLNLSAFNHRDNSIKLSFSLSNVGKLPGAEISQLYLSFPDNSGEPIRQLKDFKKVYVLNGASSKVNFELKQSELSIWDVASHSWKMLSGQYTVFICSSAEHVHLEGSFQV